MSAAATDASPRLADVLEHAGIDGARNPRLTGIGVDSRTVRPGYLFAACAGDRRHGLEFADDAVNQGAVAVAWEPVSGIAPDAALSVPTVPVPDLARRLGELAARVYGHPSADLPVLAVTGTDGKTSVSQFLAQVLGREDAPCGVIGTLGYGLYPDLDAATHTTPDAARLQGLLAGFRDRGAGHVVMEASSHALFQGRLNGTVVDVAVLTNLGRDHLDYHITEQAYAEAKRLLFRQPGLRSAVINLDDSFGCSVRRSLHADINRIGYSMQADSDAHVVVTSFRPHATGFLLEAVTPVGVVALDLPLLGRFNAQNVLAVIGALVALGWRIDAIQEALASLRSVPGRMQRLHVAGRPLVVVDYAHTPGALEAALCSLRAHVDGRVICLFGCGGDRDRGKRPLMAAAAERYADQVVITDDNPRNEPPGQIVADILAGFRGLAPMVVHDRAAAIAEAIRRAAPEDVVLVAGKGHEAVQVGADGPRPFNDADIVRGLLQEAKS